jgi:hypothetical protein
MCRHEKEKARAEPEPKGRCCVDRLIERCRNNEKVREAWAHFGNGVTEMLKGMGSLIEAPMTSARQRRESGPEGFRKIEVEESPRD